MSAAAGFRNIWKTLAKSFVSFACGTTATRCRATGGPTGCTSFWRTTPWRCCFCCCSLLSYRTDHEKYLCSLNTSGCKRALTFLVGGVSFIWQDRQPHMRISNLTGAGGARGQLGARRFPCLLAPRQAAQGARVSAADQRYFGNLCKLACRSKCAHRPSFCQHPVFALTQHSFAARDCGSAAQAQQLCSIGGI